MSKIIAVLAAIAAPIAGSCPVIAQVPQTMPPNTVFGRAGIGPGPGQAIPFATVAAAGGANIFVQGGTGAATRTPQDKNRERVSVLDYTNTGVAAVCGGVDAVDDSVAINKAVAYVSASGGGQVVFPPFTDCRIKNPINAVAGVHFVGQGGINGVPSETSIIRPSANLTAMILQPDLTMPMSDFGIIGMTLEGRKGSFTVTNMVRVSAINSRISHSIIRSGSGNCVLWDRNSVAAWVNFFDHNEFGDCDGFNFFFSGSDSFFDSIEFGGGGAGNLYLESSGGNTLTNIRCETSTAGGGCIIIQTPNAGDPNCLGGNNTAANSFSGGTVQMNNIGIYYKKGTCAGNAILGDIVSGITFIGNTLRSIHVEAGITNGHIGPNAFSADTPSASYLGFIPGTNNTGWTFEGTVGGSTLTENAPADLKIDVAGSQQVFHRDTGVFRTSLTVTGAFTATGLVTNADLANPATTVNGQTCTLGSTCTVTAAPSGSAGGDLTGTYPSPTLGAIISAGGPTGSATVAPIITYDAKGRLTAVSSATVTPAIGSVTGLGTGVATALGINVGSAGAPVTFNGALGTPSSGIATNLTGTASGLTAGNVTTNANLTGDVTSVGNATTLASGNAGNLNSGTLLAARMPALTGDVTTSAGAVATSLTNAAVTYAKIQNLGALAVMGRAANSSGVGADIQATAASGAVLRESGSTIGFGTIATAGIANNAVTLAKLATQGANTVLGNATAGAAVPTALTMPDCAAAATCALQWTAASGFVNNTSITAAAVPASGLTGTTLAASVVSSSLTGLGTITTGVWNAGAVTSSGAIQAAAAAGYKLGSTAFATSGSGYTQINDGGGTTVLTLGSSDPTNYYDNTTHTFRNRAANVTYVTMATGATGIQFNGYGAGALSTNASGVISASDERLKDIVATFKGGLASIQRMDAPVVFKWKSERETRPDARYIGWTAQGVRRGISDAVKAAPDGTLNYDDRAILAALRNAVLELKANNDNLKREVGKLKRRASR